MSNDGTQGRAASLSLVTTLVTTGRLVVDAEKASRRTRRGRRVEQIILTDLDIWAGAYR